MLQRRMNKTVSVGCNYKKFFNQKQTNMKRAILILTAAIIVSATSVHAGGRNKTHAKHTTSALKCTNATCPDMAKCPFSKEGL
jgi:hypothetical protein